MNKINYIIDENKINEILSETKKAEGKEINRIIEKSLSLKGLQLDEAALLLNCNEKNLLEKIFLAAREVKEKIYGKRLVLFAPLYLTNYCANNCLYCAFRKDNKELNRKRLSQQEIRKETEFLLGEGHKRLLLVAGEDPCTGIDYLAEAVETIYSTKKGNGEIRRVNVNAAPLELNEFRRLKKAGIGTYQLFQETYHQETYKKMHPSGPKADYFRRLNAMDKAMQAGIDDLGLGVLFGLHNYKFEVLALLSHSNYLDKKFGVGPHTISVPRIEPALNAPAANSPPFPVSDQDFKKLVAVLRLSVPYTGMILSTREKSEFRDQVFSLGISQISAGSRTNPGGYSEKLNDSSQFSLHDSRQTIQVVKDICRQGFSPSFCTACYRLGRTGKDFMDLAKPGLIQNYCLPNSLLTFKEYLLDYADQELKGLGKKVIQEQIAGIKSEKILNETKKKLTDLEKGKRDLYF